MIGNLIKTSGLEIHGEFSGLGTIGPRNRQIVPSPVFEVDPTFKNTSPGPRNWVWTSTF